MHADRTERQHCLKGFSGCRLEVFRFHERTFVRKTVRDRGQNEKLMAEYSKLDRLREVSRETSLFRVPELFKVGVTPGGVAFYEVAFVPGWELDSHMGELLPGTVDRLAHQLFEITQLFSQRPVHRALNPAQFLQAKFQETECALSRDARIHGLAASLVTEFADRVGCLDLSDFETEDHSTFCHGDLALDNVLISRDGQVYLIDPLVNGHECFLWDIAKVFQSSLGRWKNIKHGEFRIDVQSRKIRLQSSDRVALFNAAFAALATQAIEPRHIILYLAATIARAAKYWKTVDQLCALLLIANELLDRFLNGSCHLDESLSSMRW